MEEDWMSMTEPITKKEGLSHMTTPITIMEPPTHTAEKILRLTLEIIFLLTGETTSPFSHDHVTIKVPPPLYLIPESNTQQKILEVTNRINELLTGEVTVRCLDVAVYLSMEEREYLQEHKDLYKDIMMEDQHYQEEDLVMVKVEVKDEEERGDEPWIEEEFSPEDKASGNYSRMNKEKQTTLLPTGGTEDGDILVCSSRGALTPPNLDLALHPADLSSNPYTQGELLPACDHAADGLPQKPFYSSHIVHLIMQNKVCEEKIPSSCFECGKSFSQKVPQTSHGDTQQSCTNSLKISDLIKEDKSSSCSECGKCYSQNMQRRERLYSCSECGKAFYTKSALTTHKRVHTGEKPYSCSECGRCFSEQSTLQKHIRLHTGEKPYSCSECGKSFTQKIYLVKHERVHTGEKPYSCSQCGKCFTQKTTLIVHERTHTGVKPFSCSQCGKCFSQKSHLTKHARVHTG